MWSGRERRVAADGDPELLVRARDSPDEDRPGRDHVDGGKRQCAPGSPRGAFAAAERERKPEQQASRQRQRERLWDEQQQHSQRNGRRAQQRRQRACIEAAKRINQWQGHQRNRCDQRADERPCRCARNGPFILPTDTRGRPRDGRDAVQRQRPHERDVPKPRGTSALPSHVGQRRVDDAIHGLGRTD